MKDPALNLQIKSPDELDKALRDISVKINGSGLNAVTLNLYGSQILVRNFELPALSAKEVKGALRLEAAEIFSLMPDDIEIDYQVIYSVKKKIKGVFIAIPKKIFNAYIDRIIKAKLVPAKITANVIYRINYFLYKNKIENRNFCIIDFYKDGIINLAVFDNKGKCELLREFQYENIDDAEREIMYSLKYASGKSTSKGLYDVWALGQVNNKETLVANLKQALNTEIKPYDIDAHLNGSLSEGFFNIDLVRNNVFFLSARKRALQLFNAVLAVGLLFLLVFCIRLVNQHLLIKKLSSSFTASQYSQAAGLQEKIKLFNHEK